MAIKKIKDMDENQEQAFICSWCLQNGLVPVAVPNGVNLNATNHFRKYGISEKEIKIQSAIQMKMLKREGLHVGFPDMMIFGENPNGAVLFLENKVKNNKPTEIQLACHKWLRSLGFTVEVSKDSKDAIQKIKDFFRIDMVQQTSNVIYLEERRRILEAKKCKERTENPNYIRAV